MHFSPDADTMVPKFLARTLAARQGINRDLYHIDTFEGMSVSASADQYLAGKDAIKINPGAINRRNRRNCQVGVARNLNCQGNLGLATLRSGIRMAKQYFRMELRQAEFPYRIIPR